MSIAAKVDGSWAGWEMWSVCAGSCGTGCRLRVRTCTNPTPSGGGTECSGEEAEASVCPLSECVGM